MKATELSELIHDWVNLYGGKAYRWHNGTLVKARFGDRMFSITIKDLGRQTEIGRKPDDKS